MDIKGFFKKLVPTVDNGQEEQKKPQQKDLEVCALCNQGNPETKWMGQYWHKNCLRKAKKMAKKMI
ncbi:MAG: hypothetical protein COT55_02290 [Candidatus Diapherotrites archaeon CG09_land_8_20_14_0_10_32_12]|nr:MAG: hypothetical protein COT55_02290 [Candidatus Diapherotrites archaeon CG09_land_8_20_14_0_10_32_12]